MDSQPVSLPLYSETADGGWFSYNYVAFDTLIAPKLYPETTFTQEQMQHNVSEMAMFLEKFIRKTMNKEQFNLTFSPI